MPVVLVEVGGVARSGHSYGDQTGVEYEFPSGRYERMIETGDRFVYQVPGIGYTGCGIIGVIRQSQHPSRLICQVLSVEFFDTPVSLKSATGGYFEADTTYWQDRVYWGQGVRPLSASRFDAILAASEAAGRDLRKPAKDTPSGGHDTQRDIHEYSVEVAIDSIRRLHSGVVSRMPRCNRGFDLTINAISGPARLIKVRGTHSPRSTFSISEGERLFSIAHARNYILVVVSGINLGDRTHTAVTMKNGPVEGRDFELSPAQWHGLLLTNSDVT